MSSRYAFGRIFEEKNKKNEKNVIKEFKNTSPIEEKKFSIREVVNKIYSAYSLKYDERKEEILKIKNEIKNSGINFIEKVIIELLKKYEQATDIERGKIIFMINNFFRVGCEVIISWLDRMKNDDFHLTNEEKNTIMKGVSE